VLRKANVKIAEPDAALLKEVRTRSQPIIDAWIERATKERGLDGRKVYNEFHEELIRVADELKRASGGK
jgi:molecular chaperone GrpE (heat shock protein)